jgi:hypothetical protein
MSLAWEASDEDIEIVLERHSVVGQQLADRAFRACQANAGQIERAALAYGELDDQTASALDAIERVLVAAGIIKASRKS